MIWNLQGGAGSAAQMSGVVGSAATSPALDSLYDMIVAGGPLMWPIGLCSVVALAFIVERTLRLRGGGLGTVRFGRQVVAAVREQGPEAGLMLCEDRSSSLARILRVGLARQGDPHLEVEKAVEDTGAREVKRLSANLRPLVVVGMIAPLLGLLGTVWGMIEAFSNIATQEGLGKPELLASGISQALVTTAAGLAVAIPAQAAYFYYKSRIDKFVRRTEELYAELTDALRERRKAAA